MASTYEQVGKIRAAGTAWTLEGKYWLFGTATYKQGDLVSAEKLERDACRFFNALDRAVLPRIDVNAGRRLPRLVYAENGRFGANRHIHFYIKGWLQDHYGLIERHAEHAWLKTVDGARDVKLKDCSQPGTRRGSYGWKEYKQLGNINLLLDCCQN